MFVVAAQNMQPVEFESISLKLNGSLCVWNTAIDKWVGIFPAFDSIIVYNKTGCVYLDN